MPFDFDGRRLLWMTYLENDIRQLNIFDFDEKKERKKEKKNTEKLEHGY